MVGDPKTISDLARLDANPVAKCRRCVWAVEFDRGALIRARLQAGLGTDWRTFLQDTRCDDCGGPVTIRIKPFVSDKAVRAGDVKQTLVFKALCVLVEAQADAKQGKVRASLGLRFALAYLYAVGDRRGEWFDRQPYVEFWQVATMGGAAYRGLGHDPLAYGRSMQMQTCVNAIARAAGMPHTPELGARLSAAVGDVDTPPPRQAASNDV